jgi:Flp pilus assembly protein protease CpaA
MSTEHFSVVHAAKAWHWSLRLGVASLAVATFLNIYHGRWIGAAGDVCLIASLLLQNMRVEQRPKSFPVQLMAMMVGLLGFALLLWNWTHVGS